MTEESFDEWAKRFQVQREFDGYVDGKAQYKEVPLNPAKCMFPVREGPHMRACLVGAHHRSIDGYPVCQHHTRKPVRPAWRGYFEGA